LYPKNEAFKVGSYGTYQLMDGTVCRVLKTCYDKDLDLYEKLGFLHGAMIYGVMDPPTEIVSHLGGNVSPKHLNAYYQDDVMLYKAPDPQEGLCVNDTCWTRDDAVAYATSYKADPYHEEVMAYIRRLQMATGIHDLQSHNPINSTTHIIDLQGRRIDNSKLPRGIYIEKGKKIAIK
ncbi:MAG: hypothetical protein K6G92_01830, partial [Bacteroidaceae bacterium]|nr:hypothetical protein [Bacteroidaceae bacterium]